MKINAQTKLYAVIGNPVSQSLSPRMHNAVFKRLGLNYVFLAFEVKNVKKALDGLKEIGIRGISVTIPHKIEIMKYVDNLDDTAKNIGAINTIINIDNKFTGLNTDWIGAIKALEEKTSLSGKKISLLGAGGAARAISYGLKKKNAHIAVFSRNINKAKVIFKDFGLSAFGALDEIDSIEDADMIINSTSIGMTPNDKVSPIPIEIISHKHIVFDIVCKPHETKLLSMSKKKGATIIYGERMLLYQAVEQFKLFTGVNVPLKVMEEALYA